MRVLVACEFSGRVRDAFLARGHDAVSCDLLPSEVPGPHYTGDVRDLIADGGWDLMVAHPPCTHLAVSGARWFALKEREQAEALDFVRCLLGAPIPRIALENPISIISSRIRKPDQIIQPWQFGHGETKATCLWLKNLPALRPTNIVDGREARVHRAPSGTGSLEGAESHIHRGRSGHGRAVGGSMIVENWLNVGCGEFYAEGWHNIDLPTTPHRKDEALDVTDGLPYDDGQFDLVYLGHLLEHISLDWVPAVLHEVKRVCSGRVMVVGPDMDRAALGGDPHAMEHGGHRWPGDEHLWLPTAALVKQQCARVFSVVDEIRIVDVPPPWPVVSRAPWQCAVECRS